MPPETTDKPIVLIVDDEVQVAMALGDLLEDDYEVIIELSPQAALEVLAVRKSIAVIISDQRMPGMTGDELFARAQEISIATRVLITAYADITAVISAVNQGKIFAYITKPWKPDDIVITVSRAAAYCDLNRRVLREQALLHQLMESSIDAIAIKDRDGRYVKLNNAEAGILGAASLDAAEGRTVADFLPPERSAQRLRDERQLVTAGAPVRDRVERIAAGGRETVWYSSNIAPIRDLSGDISGMIVITRDMTESKRLDEMKDHFIATVRHELRTPLTAIHAALGLLKASGIDHAGERAARLIEVGHANCGRLLLLVTDLLDTLSLENGDMTFDRTAVSLEKLLADAAAAGHDRSRLKNVDVSVEPVPSPFAVDGDGARLLQVIDKLVANAIELSPPGSTVTLQAKVAARNKVRISVFDRGPGVKPEIAPRLFEKFSQGDSSSTRQKGGVGLGLYIARSIVEAHGGTIDFAGRPGGGSEFYFELPVAGSREQGDTACDRMAAQR